MQWHPLLSLFLLVGLVVDGLAVPLAVVSAAPPGGDPNFIASPADLKARIPAQLRITRPDYVVFVPEVGEYGVSDTGNEHFLVFDEPEFFMDHDGVSLGKPGTRGRTDLALYSSWTVRDNRAVLWYPDRKFFLLGRHVPDRY